MTEWAEFFHMGGYARYVWSAYAITLGVLLANIAIPALRRRRLERELKRRLAREEERS